MSTFVLSLLTVASAAGVATAQVPAPVPAPVPVPVPGAAAAAGASAPSQAPTPAPPTPSAQAAPLTAGWRDGFFVQTANGDFRLQIGLLVHVDGRFAVEDEPETVTDTFLIRRLRPNFRVRLHDRFDLYFNPDLAGGTLVVQDAYVDTRFSDAFRLRLGKTKTPFGLERLQSSSNMLFFERGLPTSLVPNRDVGIQVLGDLAGGRVSYSAGFLNGVADGGSADVDTNDSKELAGRLVIKPVAGLSLAVAGSTGHQAGAAALPSFRTSSVQQTYFSYTGAAADGRRTRVSPQVSYYVRQFGGFGEYVRTTVPVAKAGLRHSIEHEAWQVAVSFVLTGEAATEGGVRPRANFDFDGGHLGAFQIAARYHTLEVDRTAIALGFAAANASRKAAAWTAGLNWYLTPQLKYVVNFERTVFDSDTDGPRKAENVLVFRSQVNF
jgi:phosphate-selective porin OprO/OprP